MFCVGSEWISDELKQNQIKLYVKTKTVKKRSRQENIYKATSK